MPSARAPVWVEGHVDCKGPARRPLGPGLMSGRGTVCRHYRGQSSSRPSQVSFLVLSALLGLLIAHGGRGQEPPKANPAAEVRWLEERSMLRQARDAAARRVRQRASSGGTPTARRSPGRPSGTPPSGCSTTPARSSPRPGRSVIATWADPALWDALRDLGIDLLHTGPVNRAGGVEGHASTRPTTDGWFDRDLARPRPGPRHRGRVRPAGRRRRASARRSVAGDLVPLHTGLGPDFHLALRGVQGLPRHVHDGRDRRRTTGACCRR